MRLRLVTVVLVGGVLVLAGCAAPVPSGGTATGDRRDVSEPAAPSETCATVPAQLTLANGEGTDDQEQDPPDTVRLQQALDSCAQGHGAVVAVELAASGSSSDFLSGPLTVREGEVLVVDPGVTLSASRNPADYEADGHPTCGTIGGSGGGCRPFLTLAGSHAGLASKPDAVDGSRGRIDGRGGATMLGSAQSWWDLSAAAKSGGAQNVPRLVQARHVDDITLHDIDLVDAAGFHVSFQDGDGLTVWGVRIRTPSTARNTDGIDPAGATDVTVAHSWIMDGDDGIAIKGGSSPSAHISIIDDHFFGTHGISIGSETTAGVSDVLVADDTVSGTDADGTASVASAAIRIKSSATAGGPVTDIAYRNVCADAVKAPIDIDADYASGTGSTTPQFTDITIDGFRSSDSPSSATSTVKGHDAAHPLGVTVADTSVDTGRVDAAYADITTEGATFGGAPLQASGPDVTVTDAPSEGTAPTCTSPSYPAP